MPSKPRQLIIKLTTGIESPEKLPQAFTVAATAVASGGWIPPIVATPEVRGAPRVGTPCAGGGQASLPLEAVHSGAGLPEARSTGCKVSSAARWSTWSSRSSRGWWSSFARVSFTRCGTGQGARGPGPGPWPPLCGRAFSTAASGRGAYIFLPLRCWCRTVPGRPARRLPALRGVLMGELAQNARPAAGKAGWQPGVVGGHRARAGRRDRASGG